MAKTPTPKMTIPSSKVEIALAAGSVEPAMKAAEAKSTKLFKVPVSRIEVIPGFNVRVDSPDYRAHRDSIAASIKANGFDQTKPLSGYVHKSDDGNVIYVTDGHTRLDAVKTLNKADAENAIATLPVLIHPADKTLTDLTVALHTSNTGRPLSPFELGVVVKRLLKEDGAEKTAIAGRLAVTPRYLDDVLLLVNGPKAVREAVLNGHVSSTMAIQEIRKAGDEPDKAAEKITAAVNKAKAAGKTKATKKDVGPKMQTIRTTVSVAADTDMKEIVKTVAAQVRKAITAHDGDEEGVKLASVDGTIKIAIEVPAPEKAEKPKAEKKPAAKKDAKPAKSKAEKRPVEKKPDLKAKDETLTENDDLTADGDDEDADLGVEGAEEVTSEDDSEALDMPAPPAVKNGAGVPDDADVDI